VLPQGARALDAPPFQGGWEGVNYWAKNKPREFSRGLLLESEAI
jgi:hypothetical protein